MRTDRDAPKKRHEKRCSEKQQNKQYENRCSGNKNPDKMI